MLAIGAVNTTGPVGNPVGEPPLGSMLTASPCADLSAANIAALNGSLASPTAGRSPSDTGLAPLPGNIHN